ncbi:epoxyqueuosine reductase QueH, partial [Campylobacter coli]|uniref:epoxyqueuosine reductase QueH n=1 Tax=Campylobacter coli TaxID=195 RepID=UPI0039A6BC91
MQRRFQPVNVGEPSVNHCLIKIIGYFYDPNIHPLSEYELRFLDVKRSCDKLGIKLYKGEYEY